MKQLYPERDKVDTGIASSGTDERRDILGEADEMLQERRLLANIPEELRRRDQWVVWKIEQRDGKGTKVPYIAGSVGRASATESLTWRSFEDAVLALRTGPYAGVGFVFSSGDPYAGVDLDGCRDSETGELEEWAVQIVRELDGYAEASPSGTGVHVIVRGKAPNKRQGGVEAYSSERFFTMTGEVL